MSQDLLLPHQKEALEWAISRNVRKGSEDTPVDVIEVCQDEPVSLPQIISDVKRAYKGYRVHSEAEGWKFYATACLDSQQISDLEDWLIDLEPGKKAG